MKNFYSFFVLVGTIIGAGILSLPFVLYKLGIFLFLFLSIFVFLLTYFSSLIILKASYKNKEIVQLPGIFEKYFGKNAKNAIFLMQILSIYGALIAYMIGISSTLSPLFKIDEKLVFLPFFFFSAIIVYKGMYEVRLSEVLLTGIKIFLLIFISLYLFLISDKQLSFENDYSARMIFEGYGVIMFAFMCYSILPNLRRLDKNFEKSKKTVVFGLLFSFLIYLIFSLSSIIAYKQKTSQLITLNAKNFVEKVLFSILIIFLLITPYLSLSWSLKDVFIFDFGLHYKKAWFFSVIIPFLIFMTFPLKFINVIEFVGSVFGSLLYFLVFLLWLKIKD